MNLPGRSPVEAAPDRAISFSGMHFEAGAVEGLHAAAAAAPARRSANGERRTANGARNAARVMLRQCPDRLSRRAARPGVGRRRV
jgi:hypothetical protein